ncbi:RDD family protein [Fulvivirga maritima]|uniref:RDD family protein n=1 Tax=Fulvivirga maritima TaxID=2904247 RepID=UPI001F2E2ADD|nr:RDD family protein [Fulvivirga maritima]UII28385.1 RDD family protein [Fulvivirga maritima]
MSTNIMNDKPNTGIRIASMFVDHILMGFIMSLCSIPYMSNMMANIFKNHSYTPIDFNHPFFYVVLFGMSLYFSKDAISGRSLAKRILGLQVINYKTGKIASPLRCFVRNIFIIFWPIEVIITLANPKRRLGDLVAGTEVVVYDKENHNNTINYGQLGTALLLSYGLVLLMSWPLRSLQEYAGDFQTKPVPTSYDISKVGLLELQLKSKLPDDAVVSVLAYNKIIGQPDKAYLEITIILNEQYSSDKAFNELHDQVISIINTQYAKDTYKGYVYYKYKTDYSVTAKTVSL